MIRLQQVPYGRGAAEALRRAIADAKGSEPLAPVTVIVPSNHVGVATRRFLASGALGSVCGRGVGLAAVDFLTTYRLAELIGAPVLAGAGRRPVSTPVIAAAVRASLASEPGPFGPVAQHPATEAALVETYRELRDVSEAGLDQLARSSRRAAEVVRLQRDTRRRLVTAWYDEQDLMAAAAGELRSGAAPEGLGTVVVYLPQLLSRHATDLLATAALSTDLLVLAGVTGVPRADAEVELTLARLDLPTNATTDDDQPGRALVDLVATDRTRILTASDSDDEVRAAVRAVVDAARSGTALDRIAILHAGPGPYGRLAHEHLTAAGIASNGPSVVPLTSRIAGRFLLDLLELDEHGYLRPDVMTWMSDAPLLADGRPIPISRWERASRDAGVVGGRSDWDRRLARRAAEASERAVLLDDANDESWAADRSRSHADQALALRSFVLEVIESIDQARTGTETWDAHAAWARGLLDRYLGAALARNAWPPVEQKAAERVDRALDRLAALASVEGPVPLSVFHRTFELELESDLGRVGRFGEGVLVGPISMGIGLDLDLVIVLGLAEGTFPTRVRDDSLLPDADRQSTRDELPLRRARVDSQHRQFLATIASGPRHLLTFPRGDLRRSVEHVPSRWLLDAAGVLAGRRLWSPELATLDEPWLTHIGSFDAGLRTLAFPATAQEHRLRALLADPDPARQLADSPDPVLVAGHSMVVARRSDQFTRYDGNLGSVALSSPVQGTTSATALERWPRCPHAYFQHQVLGVRETEDPDDELQITPINRGNLVHKVLEEFMVEVLAQPDGPPAPDEPWSLGHRDRLIAIAHDVSEFYQAHGLTGRSLFWRRDRDEILRDLDAFLVADSVHRSTTQTSPLAAEMRFGIEPDGLPPVSVPLPDGRTISFRGAADRVDRADGGAVHVVDYKTGKADRYTKLSEENPIEGGMLLQLPIYGLAARSLSGDPHTPMEATYWFVSTKGKFKRPGYAVSDHVLNQLSATLGWIVHGIDRGLFPPHPTNESTKPFVECVYCDPDGLGVGDLRRQWNAKRSDPLVATYADAVEPVDSELDDLGIDQ